MLNSKIKTTHTKGKPIEYNNDQSFDNTPFNPTYKVSFRGIKRNNQPHTLCDITERTNYETYKSPMRINKPKMNLLSTQREDCNKFSVLLESKGFSNCGSAKKKIDDSSYKTPLPFLADLSRHKSNAEITKFQINTSRKENESIIEKGFGQIRTERNSPRVFTPKNNVKNFFESNGSKLIIEKKQGRPETERTPERIKLDKIQEKCREIKSKQYLNHMNLGELNSLNKLKSKVISPLKRKSESQPDHLQQEKSNLFEHSSILSENDQVNMSKTNESIDFDMSPCL